MTDVRTRFYKQLAARNADQRKAIETIDGPVMVVAGPGTGKTDVLGLRIGYILENTDVAIQNILCLTYTEAGAVEMRKRLLEYIGPTAYNAQVYTFHGFCNMVIHEHMQLFQVYRESQPASDLEQFQVLKELIDEQRMDHPLRRYTGQIYYETQRLRNLFAAMKLEEWNPEFMRDRIEQWVIDERESGKYVYKRRTTRKGKVYLAGDMKHAQFKREVEEPMRLLRSAVDLFDDYNAKLRARGRYDYHDMLTWVRDKLGQDDVLLAMYQERFQYFLVDEFQDTNGIQLTLLNLLVNHWDRPDVFVVGDDDQSIFRFQGALMQNITAFKDMHQPEVVVLTDNYRSSQHILNAAGAVIGHNTERLVTHYPQYTKQLVARGEFAGLETAPEVRIYPNWTQEQAALLQEITEMHESGELAKQTVAVIYRRHNQVEELVHALELRQIPLNVRRPVDILYRPVIKNLLQILIYLQHEIEEYGSGEPFLYELLLFRYFNLNHRDVGHLALHCRRLRRESNMSWREVMGNEYLLHQIGINDPASIAEFDRMMTGFLSDFRHQTVQELVEQVMTKTGLLRDVFDGPNATWQLQLVKTFFDHVKSEGLRDPQLSLKSLLANIELLKEYTIELPVHKTITSPAGVHFVTAHSAKGMQFDKVFILGCTRRIWADSRRSFKEFKLPGLQTVAADTTDEDERRLFYVAMTRARRQLVISYSLLTDDGREQEASRFVEEVLVVPEVRGAQPSIGESSFHRYCQDILQSAHKKVPLIDDNLLDIELASFAMSVSALNLYLECPKKFYFEKILKVPTARKTYFGFGQAVHAALDQFVTWNVVNGKLTGSAVQLVDAFEYHMRKYRSYFTEHEYALHKHYGKEILPSYFEQRSHDWTRPLRIETEYRITNAQHDGVPITGLLDRVDFYQDRVVVTDYKTGKPSHSTGKFKVADDEQPGGNYWRQIVFYKMLIDADPRIQQAMPYGYVDFVQPDSEERHPLRKLVVSDQDEATVSEQLQTVYQRIMQHDFGPGCGKDDCTWCNLNVTDFANQEEETDILSNNSNVLLNENQ